MSFSEAAARLLAIAAQRLGWTPDTFWQATPADLLMALGPADPALKPLTRPDLSRMMEHDRHG